MRKILNVSLLAAFVSLSSAVALGQDKSFSGSWELVPAKSGFGRLPDSVAAPSKMSVEADIDSIFVRRIFTRSSTLDDVLGFNAPAKKSYPDKDTFKSAMVKRTKDKSTIIFDTHYEVNGREWEYHRTEAWTLSKSGRKLTVERITTMPDRIDKVKAVYTRNQASTN